ncbi:hypothetical protein [Phthorimaea operculella granulovirus]|uniref:Uncharacterized protein n=1 Tax=Phthorimaea operculella granulovirus TaxID=192584 RepID=Q8JRT5_9BBAC|nr:hypothetical protein [Phthorimaea operculella granulovirus]AAM70322.1 hypothetical protein [Phthorimaea operculella granulovirus]ANY57513.1 hypothetical protein PhopGVgp124 [Phthorimaea operculella granulovirus]QBH65959.1 hypothetical protein PhopGVgp124 [Phthorimaea operculella granulovirus]QBH66089.1 hypothetical protein PhopGVgp124 [Phthorimaea operculella granulovirus]QBH66219.1 hypothetical protein PhopGVgp124 [Phthorimaea operculella granulovirus]
MYRIDKYIFLTLLDLSEFKNYTFEKKTEENLYMYTNNISGAIVYNTEKIIEENNLDDEYLYILIG